MVPHMDNYFEMYMSLRCEVKALKQTVKEFKSGKRYLKLQADQHRVIAGYVKEIKKLKDELASAHKAVMNLTDEELDQVAGGWWFK